jgi:GTPase SAR1 family protein
MNIIIIFTKIDGYTRPYFTNYFQRIENEGDFILQVENLVFISDTMEEPAIDNLTNIIDQHRAGYTFYVFYHATANALTAQQNFIRTKIVNQIEYEIDDHHNEDGLHFDDINQASIYYKDGNMQLFKNQIESLIQKIRNHAH